MTTHENQNGRKPDFTIYVIPERDGAPWIAIGAAWENKDREGYSLRFDLMPAAGSRIMLRKPKQKSDADTKE